MAHRSQVATGLALFLVLNFAFATGQQPIERAGASAVDGVVVKLGTGEPLADAEVELSRVEDAATYKGKTGNDGKFSFENVPPGQYRLAATRTGGFMPTEYGQRNPGAGGIPFTLDADRRLAGVRLAMAATGTISGRIFDTNGEPAGLVSVQALRVSHSQLSQRMMTVVQSVLTNDLGEYRLFWLPPGRYYLSARLGGSPPFLNPLNGSITEAFSISAPFLTQRTLENGDLVEEANTPVYFPGTTDALAASPIEVGTSLSIDGMDFILADPVPTRHVQGIVINGDTGQPAANVRITVAPGHLTHEAIISTGLSGEDGAFDISGVVPGSHVVSAILGAHMELTGYVPVEVGNADVDGITIVAARGFDLSGKIIFDSALSNQVPRVIPAVQRTLFMGLPPPQPSGVGPPNPNSDGSFVLRSLARGDYQVFAREPGSPLFSEKFYIKSIRFGTSDVLTNGLHIESKPDTELEIVVGTDVATVHGSAVNQKQEPVPNATVALIPYPIGSGRIDRYKNAATDVTGQFQINGIAPGDYLAIGWDNVEFGAWLDSDFVRSYESAGKRIHIGEGTSESVQVTIYQ